jgi:alpha-tubulin suppressor-like RCC1 family protein
VVTDRHELGCFDRLYARPDLSPPRALPSWIEITGIGSVTDVAAGGDQICAVTVAGDVVCGRVVSGALRSARVALPATAVDVEVGDAHACARLATGAVACWGANSDGQLGLGGREDTSATPREVPELRGAKALALGAHHTCAITADDRVACAGWNHRGQVGVGPRESASYVTRPVVLDKLHDIVRIAADRESTHAWDRDGQHYAWGTVAGETQARPPHDVSGAGATLDRGAHHACDLDAATGVVACRELFESNPHPAEPPMLPLQ